MGFWATSAQEHLILQLLFSWWLFEQEKEPTMSKTDLVNCLLQLNKHKLTSIEKILIETILLTRIYQELANIFTSRYTCYQSLIKSNLNQEEGTMNRVQFMQEVIKDILSTNEYSLQGIATYTQIPEDVLSDVAMGMNPNPTFEFSRKLFELHIMVRRNLYDGIMRKIVADYKVQ
jgi:hypothetical protein